MKKVIGEHLKTALAVEDFSITFAKQETNDWRVNVEYPEKIGIITFRQSALFTIDGETGEVKVFERGRFWTFWTMGFIRHEIEIVGSRKTARVLALFDSGALYNHIKEVLTDGETPDDIGFPVWEGQHNSVLANGAVEPGYKVRFRELRIKNASLEAPLFIVMENLTCDAIIGVATMQQLGIALDPPEETLYFARRYGTD